MKPPEDVRLIQRALKNDRTAIQRLYDRHEAYWFRICLRYAKDRTEAQDAFQEGVLQVFQKLSQFDPARGNFQGWSNTIIVHEVIRYLKAHQWQHSFEELSETTAISEPPEVLPNRLTAQELTQLIQQLPFGYRMVFNLHELEGYTHPEIAQILNISVGTSKSQLSRAKKILQTQLKQLF